MDSLDVLKILKSGKTEERGNMLCETLGSGDAVVLVNFITISQKGKKMHSERKKNSIVKEYAKLWLLLTCQIHEAHVGMAGENSPEKNLCRSGAPGKGWPNATHFQNTLHVSSNIPCTTVPKRFRLHNFQWGARVRNIHNNMAGSGYVHYTSH